MLRGDTAVETKAGLKAVSTKVKCSAIYLNIEEATLYLSLWNKIAVLYLQRNNIF